MKRKEWTLGNCIAQCVLENNTGVEHLVAVSMVCFLVGMEAP